MSDEELIERLEAERAIPTALLINDDDPLST
jgi:hypothetical protein